MTCRRRASLRILLLPCLLLALCPASLRAQQKDLDPDHAAKMAKGLDLFKSKVKPLLEGKCLRCHGGETVEIGARPQRPRQPAQGRACAARPSSPARARTACSSSSSAISKSRTCRTSGDQAARRGHRPDRGVDRPRRPVRQAARREQGEEDAPGPRRCCRAEAKKFWSFQPLAEADAAGGQERRLVPRRRSTASSWRSWKRRASRRTRRPTSGTLIRRAYFDLIGLPPTPEEVEAFVKDDVARRLREAGRPAARAARTTASAGRRHWLDLARFAESHGFEHDYDRPTAYHYRDFVIEALNQRPAVRHVRQVAARRRRVRAGRPAGAEGDRLPRGRRPQHADHQERGREAPLRRAGRHARARSAPRCSA